MNNQNVNIQNRNEKHLAEVSPEQLRTIEGGLAANSMDKYKALASQIKTNNAVPQTSAGLSQPITSAGN